jgi:hypothetical protein
VILNGESLANSDTQRCENDIERRNDTDWLPALLAAYSVARKWSAKLSLGFTQGNPGFQPLNANLSKASALECLLSRRDSPNSSQARSAWDYEENSPVPAGRLNRSWLRNHS